ncbi:hypothetical protein CK623_09615 [Vandammella animalimorsus]|uniref:Alpha-D-phosphohexomutase C-terminal domain-containing protein n=1 Tax=Vandammella animalimorsus TaxID=2029117 RepID=A0A2A2APH5_9BURK|nr:hypothetical protein CK623_09615 [Vandammella animalimorsus]
MRRWARCWLRAGRAKPAHRQKKRAGCCCTCARPLRWRWARWWPGWRGATLLAPCPWAGSCSYCLRWCMSWVGQWPCNARPRNCCCMACASCGNGGALAGIHKPHIGPQKPSAPVQCSQRLAAELQALMGNALSAPAQVNAIDGLRVDWPDGFGLIRASNTTPVLALRFEGHMPDAPLGGAAH